MLELAPDLVPSLVQSLADLLVQALVVLEEVSSALNLARAVLVDKFWTNSVDKDEPLTILKSSPEQGEWKEGHYKTKTMWF